MRSLNWVFGVAAAILALSPCHAQTVADFYKGKTVDVYIGTGGGMRLANFLYNAANKDGATFGIFNRGIGFDQLLGSKSSQFDATKFSWIGSTNNEISVCVAWHTTGVTKWQDVLTQELVVGASGPAADTFQFPKIANGVLGTKFKIISGYPGGNDIDLA